MLMKQCDKVSRPAEQPYTKGQAHVARMLTMARTALVCQMALQQSSSGAGFMHFPSLTYTPCCSNNLPRMT